jgi:hypothetical protein
MCAIPILLILGLETIGDWLNQGVLDTDWPGNISWRTSM